MPPPFHLLQKLDHVPERVDAARAQSAEPLLMPTDVAGIAMSPQGLHVHFEQCRNLSVPEIGAALEGPADVLRDAQLVVHTLDSETSPARAVDQTDTAASKVCCT